MQRTLLLLLSLSLMGCTTREVRLAQIELQKEYYRTLQAQAHEQTLQVNYRTTAISQLGVGQSAPYAIMALSMGGIGGTQSIAVSPPQPEKSDSEEARAWVGTLLPITALWSGSHLASVQARTSRDVAISTNAAFMGMGGSIERAGIAGYPYVQAPGPVTTNTLSGTGVLGSGSYVGPVSTVRTCTGGTAAGTGGPVPTNFFGGYASC